MNMTHQLTCIACRVIFDDAEAQRAHYKCDWHRYNLKRKVAELPPVTNGEFNRIVQYHTEKREEKISDKFLECQSCNKSFSSDNAYENHLKSKKHKEMLTKPAGKDKKPGEPGSSKRKNPSKVKPKPGYMPPLESYDEGADDSDEWEDVDEEELDEEEEIDDDDESEALPPNFCLFCPHESVTLEDNFRHMTKSHSFFIPDLKYVIDLEGYFIYLGAKVGDGKVCLKCNNHSKQFTSIRACQTHMLDKGHCLLDTEGDALLEYSDFYDYSPSYPDHDGSTNVDNELSPYENAISVDAETMELVLPSGARAGHRALNRYYKQNVNPEQAQTRNRGLITGLSNQYKSLGLTGAHLTVAMRKKIHARKVENVRRSDHHLRLGVKANKLQKHFRDQNEGGG